MTCHGSLRKLVPALEVVQSNMLRPYCVLEAGHCALGMEKIMRLGSLAVPTTATTAIPVAAPSQLCDASLGLSWLRRLEL